MLLLSGPSGSGKTARILDGLRDALRRKDSGVRLLVPTATMVLHAQNQMAREGFVFKPGLIQTLSRFVEPWAEDLPQASSAVLNLMVEETVLRLNRKEFSKVAHLRGFYSSLARTIEEFSSAGCDARRLSAHLPDVPFAEGFLAVFHEVERALQRRGLAMRSQRLRRVADRINQEGLPAIHTIWMNGFHALPDPELRIVEAMARHAELALTLTAAPITEQTRTRLLAMGAWRSGSHAGGVVP